MMGSGKSSIGKLLSKKWSKFIDIDVLIEKKKTNQLYKYLN